ncbi:OmpW family outer membrane protein [Limnohabitans sp.]|uniref:OmpW/AlkL family protein n=1 Tax=Limnohabitans sp. TaxID=1907725 RepID=UPI00286F346B|nr:OmpW family outer membrane protein [Limnohabitans sp.]
MKKIIISAFLAGAACSTFAADVSPWTFRIGATQITPQVESGDLTPPSFPSTKASIGSSTQLSGGITYRLDEQWSVDLPLALPFEHNLYGAGAIQGVGKLGTVKALPVTVLMQYHLAAENATIRPYVGAGITYAKFYGETGTGALTSVTGGAPSKPTTLRIESRRAPTIQIGAKIALTDIWHLDVTYLQTYFSTQNKLSTGQTLDATINPTTLSIGLGRSFN